MHNAYFSLIIMTKRWMTTMKKAMILILATFVAMGAMMYFVYDFVFLPIYVANVLFVVGSIVFFFGLILVTGAMEVFESSIFLTKKVFSKDNSKPYFKTFADYKEFHKIKNAHEPKKTNIPLIVGIVYIVISLIIV